MILISSRTDKGKWHLYNPLDNKVHKTPLNLERHERICGSSKGWLIVVDENRVVSLINPFLIGVGGTRDDEKSIVRLPPLNPPNLSRVQLKYGNYFVYKATISADPILDADNCIIMIIYVEMYQLAALRLNKDSKWTYVVKGVDRKCWPLLREVVEFEDRFYVVDCVRRFYSFDVTTQSVSAVMRECGRKDVYQVKEYLVVCKEKTVLSVQMCIVGFDVHDSVKFRAFELDISKGEWTEKKSLGDVALFVSDNSSISVCASESGYRANCIYFVRDDNRVDRRSYGQTEAYDCAQCGVYNVEEKRLLENPFDGDAETLMRKADVPPLWILPTYNL